VITLYGAGPMFGLPDPSPFVVKTITQLRIAGLPYRFERALPSAGPKSKIPFIRDGDTVLGDSVFILEHLRIAHGVDLDAHLSARERAVGWALERMLEDHLYWAIVHMRWAIDENFDKGPAQFFTGAPPEVRQARREGVRQTLQAQGFGRHSEDEIVWLAQRDFGAAAELLGEKPYLFGERPSSFDGTLYAFAASAVSPLFICKLRDAAESHANLMAYCGRIKERYFPAASAGAAA
jgi:glutathione S-transferase